MFFHLHVSDQVAIVQRAVREIHCQHASWTLSRPEICGPGRYAARAFLCNAFPQPLTNQSFTNKFRPSWRIPPTRQSQTGARFSTSDAGPVLVLLAARNALPRPSGSLFINDDERVVRWLM
jgi:hypothetical protein